MTHTHTGTAETLPLSTGRKFGRWDQGSRGHVEATPDKMLASC